MKKRLLSIAMASALLSSTAQAEIHLSGFASIVGGITTSGDLKKNQDGTIADERVLYGFDDTFNFNQGSFFAVQASSDITDKLGATVQVLAHGADDWQPEFNWAFLSYDATDDLRILAGRQRIPFYMYSDYLDVSYAFPWITPVENTYGSPFDTYDGIGAIYNTSFGDVDATFHGMFGNNNAEVPAGGTPAEAKITGMVGLASTFNYDWLTVRAAYFYFDSVTIDAFDGVAGFWDEASVSSGVDYSSLALHTQVKEDSVTFVSLGIQMNFDRFSIVSEYTELELDNTPLGSGKSYYVMASYQLLDDVLVHVTYDYEDRSAEAFTSDVAFGTNAEVNKAKAVTEGIMAGQLSEETGIAVGVRYDFHESAALKFEYKDFSDDLNSDNDAGLFRVALVTIF